MNEETLFELLVNTPGAQRPALLNQRCAGNSQLRARLEALLAADLETSFNNPAQDPPQNAQNTRAFEAPAETEGTIIAGRYKLLQQIGEGGMGSVWMADQTEPVKRRVAVKLIRTDRGNSAKILARFEAERQAIALMDHPNIARLLDAGTTDDGAPYFVMELVKGIPLNEYCDRHKLSVADRLQVFMQVCGAVQHAHQKGIIHRDLKPSNVLVESHDGKPSPKVIDFGLAKATTGLNLTENTLFTGFGTVMGTPLYMSPEQASFNASDIDTRSDIYSLGVILYELLTGTTPLTRDTIKQAALDEMLRLIREQEAPTPSSRLSSSDSVPSIAANRLSEPARLGRFVKGELDWITLKALAKERERRYETANGFAKDIERFLNQEPVSAGPPSASYRFKKFVQRNQGQVVAASLLLATLVLGMIGTTIGYFRAEQAAERERRAKIDATDAAQRERLAKNDAEAERVKAVAERDEKERQRQRAEENERLAEDRLVQVQEEQQRTEEEKRIAQAVRDFLQKKLLGQADATNQANALLEHGKSGAEVEENPRILDLLARAADELQPDRIEENFPDQPLLQAELLQTVGNTYRGIGGQEKDQYVLAMRFLERAVEIMTEQLGTDHPDTLESMNCLALAYQEAGQLDRAVLLLEETLARTKSTFGPDQVYTFCIKNNLADCYTEAGQLDRALPLLEETLAQMRTKLGPDHPRTLIGMNNLARGYQEEGEFERAMPLLEEALAISKDKLGPNHPQTFSSMNNLAVCFQDAGQLDRALPLLEETCAFFKAKLGPDHPTTLSSMNNLAIAYATAGQLDRALQLYLENFAITKDKLGLDHPSTLTSMNNLASGYRDAGQLDRALPLLEQTLALCEAKLGTDHPNTLTCMNNLADAYAVAGQLDKAIPMLERSLATRKAKHGPDHPGTIASMNNLAMGYRAASQLDRALPLLEQTLALCKDKLGPDHPNALTSMSNLALGYLDAHRFDRAIPLFEETLALTRAKLGPDHPSTLTLLESLAKAYQEAGQFDRTLSLLEEAARGMENRRFQHPSARDVITNTIAVYEKANQLDQAEAWRKKWLAHVKVTAGANSLAYANDLAALGRIFLQRQKWTDAETVFRECLNIRESTQPEVWTTYNTMSLLGATLLGLAHSAREAGDEASLARAADLYGEAEPLLIHGYEGIKVREATIPPKASTRIPEALDRLIELYTVWDKPDEAKKWQAEKEKRLQQVERPPPEESDSEKR